MEAAGSPPTRSFSPCGRRWRRSRRMRGLSDLDRPVQPFRHARPTSPSTPHPTVLRTATLSRKGRGKESRATAPNPSPLAGEGGPRSGSDEGSLKRRPTVSLPREGGPPFISRLDGCRSEQVTQGRRAAPPRGGWPGGSVGGLTCPDRHAAAYERCKDGTPSTTGDGLWARIQG
jgi:hypothetical protein